MPKPKRSRYAFGGGGSGRGGGPGGGEPGGGEPEVREIEVLTNQSRLILSPSPAAPDASDYVQCEVTIQNAGWRKSKDEATGEERREFYVRDVVAKDEEKFLRTRLPWRIMRRWARERKERGLPAEVAYDGAKKAYFPSAASSPEFGERFEVKVKRDCEEDDPDAERVRDRWFALTFRRTNTIAFADVRATLRGETPTRIEEISNMFNAILKSDAVFTKGMISLEPNSPLVFFPLEQQKKESKRRVNETMDRTKIMLSGIRLVAVFRQGRAYVQMENRGQWANKEHFEIFRREDRHAKEAARVPLLNTEGRTKTIAEVPLKDLDKLIADVRGKRDEIEEAILKKDITISYYSRKLKKEFLYKNKSLRFDRDEGSRGKGHRVIWSACDRALFTFEHDGEETTVADYFKSVHGITLEYPHMPIIFIDKIRKGGGGWFPIEFVFQAFAKSRENTGEMVKEVLKYHDDCAGGRYIEEVERKMACLKTTGDEGEHFEDRLRKWHIEIRRGAVRETAIVLEAPAIKFKNFTDNPNNGSFNLMRRKFIRPAKLSSFAVVNFCPSEQSDKDGVLIFDDCYSCVETLMEAAGDQGIEISKINREIISHRHLDLVSEHYHGNEHYRDKDNVDVALDILHRAIQKATYVHLYDSENFYDEKHVFFQTYCYSEEEKEYECLVLPPANKKGRLGLLLGYWKEGSNDPRCFSHRIKTRDGKVHKVRLMVQVRDPHDNSIGLIDPLNFRFHDGENQGCNRDGIWQKVEFVKYCYRCPQTKHIYLEQDTEEKEFMIEEKEFMHFADDWEIDFPSIIFACMPEQDKALYDRIKFMSNFGGVQTQCIVMSKFERHFASNIGPMASNIATKINTKLSTSYDKAISWTTTSFDEGRGSIDRVPWVGDLPTLVVGIGMVHGMGRASESIVAASVCLDGGCMRLSHSCFIQKRSDTISDFVMKDIVKVSLEHYAIENDQPKRILFYRDGISDGNFSKADDEISSIREAVQDKLGRNIPITFVICQSQQLGFRMVPPIEPTNTETKRGPDGQRPSRVKPSNVPSGTILSCDTNSFYLVAQGGLKGTSKPVKYIIHWNENECLNKEKLAKCTYHMSLKYPTAPKAVRELPAIKYAKKLANQVLSSLSPLMTGFTWFGIKIKLVCPADDTKTEQEQRPYLGVWMSERWIALYPDNRRHNICQNAFRNHLAA